MKIIAILFCLFLSIGALAQSGKVVKTDTTQLYSILDPSSGGKPLYVINGIIYTGNIREIDPNDIVQFGMLKPPGSVNIYGEQGKNGAALITTKSHPDIKIIKADVALADSLTDNNAMYVIDGEVSKNKLDGLDPYDVVSVNVLKDVSADKSVRVTASDVTVLIITKKYGIKSYQNKLSTFSAKYKAYLEAHQNNDSDCGYILNGEPVGGQSKNEIIKKLYEIPAGKIKTVDCMENTFFNSGDSKKEIVVITTKE